MSLAYQAERAGTIVITWSLIRYMLSMCLDILGLLQFLTNKRNAVLTLKRTTGQKNDRNIAEEVE